MKMPGHRTDAPNFSWKGSNLVGLLTAIKTPVHLAVAGVFLFLGSGCVMTKAQGDKLAHRMNYLEDEVAKLQRVRHDMEVLMVGQVKNLIDRLASLESQVMAFRESISEGSSRNNELLAELQNLRNELEQAQARYKNLEQDQQSLARNQNALKEAQNKIRIPPLKEDHFALAKKYFTANKFDEAAVLFEHFVNDYPNDKDLSYQSRYYLGESNFKLAESKETTEEKEKLYKKSVVAYQKVVEANNDNAMRIESLFKLGLALKALGNTDGSLAAFKEILSKHKKSKRAAEAKTFIAELNQN